MVTLIIPGQVPSLNQLYRVLPNRVVTMSAEGRKYKNEAKDHLAKHYHRELATFRPNRPYAVAAVFHFEELQNKTYGKPKGTETRYKKQDATNCIKLVEDIVVAVSGVDDSCTMEILLVKRQLPAGATPHTVLRVWDVEAEGSPFEALLGSIPLDDVPRVL